MYIYTDRPGDSDASRPAFGNHWFTETWPGAWAGCIDMWAENTPGSLDNGMLLSLTNVPPSFGSRSPSREKKRARWEEEKDRWSDSQSSGKEKSYTSIKEKEPEEAPPEKTEEEDEELLKPVWIRCTHSESYYSSDPMDQVVGLKQRPCGPGSPTVPCGI